MEDIKKRGRGVPYIFNNRVYFGTTKRNRGSFTSCYTSFKLCWSCYWTLMVKKKYFWFINRKKSKMKNKKIYKAKRGKGFVEGYSLGKQWRNSMQ